MTRWAFGSNWQETKVMELRSNGYLSILREGGSHMLSVYALLKRQDDGRSHGSSSQHVIDGDVKNIHIYNVAQGHVLKH